MKPRAFVVMPFGSKRVRPAVPAAAGAPAQDAPAVDFTEVYRRLIAPALEEAGCEPFRADQESAAGDIRTDMFFELVTADLVVADISTLNPNVFYELGLRHGVSPRGVLHLHGGWERQPFDVAPDRTFKYDGALWIAGTARGAGWEEQVEREVASLAATLKGAISQDRTTTSSPVYSHLPGLRPVDWRGISTARARYFHGVLDDWQERLRVARKKGWAGDILTLACDAPTRYHHEQLLFAAARALIDLCRFDVAREVLEELLRAAPEHADAQYQLGLVLSRLGEIERAEVLFERIVNSQEDRPEAQGVLGPVYKELWRTRWQTLPDLAARQQAAGLSSNLAATAAQCYAAAQRANLDDYYYGINVILLAKLLEHLAQATGDTMADSEIEDLDGLAAVVRVAATGQLERVGRRHDERSQDEAVWARATLGELALLTGDEREAQRHYRHALASPGITGFKVNSMRAQIEMLAALGYRPQVVEPLLHLLDKSAPRPAREFAHVVVASGAMVDRPGRAEPRFPAEREEAVREAMAARLERWRVGKGDLALCGGACGADLLFAELCLERGARLRLLLPLPEGEFLGRSVRIAGGRWEERFFAVKRQAEVWCQHERLGPPPEGANAFERNNLWLLNTARVEAPAPPEPPFYALLVWDGKTTGDGAGGTHHFAAEVERIGGQTAVIDPSTS